MSDAIHHAAAGGEIVDASDLVAEHWRAFFNHGRLATVTAWLDSLPPGVVERDRRLAAARAWLALDLGRLEDAGLWIARAEAAGGELDATTALPMAVQRFKVGDLVGARDAATRAIKLEPDERSFERSVAGCLAGVILHWSGEEDAAAETLTSELAVLREGATTSAPPMPWATWR